MTIGAIASAIYNDVVAGLAGYTSNPTISLKQLEDEVVEERCQVIKEMILQNILKKNEVLLSINCIPTDCKDASRCCHMDTGQTELHFQIPQLMADLGSEAIEYIGSTDREEEYKVYMDVSYQFHKYKTHGKNKPFVYIEPTPNENGFYDGWLFNVPYAKYITIIGVFKDPRQLKDWDCCNSAQYLELGSISNEVKKRLTQKKLMYYRQNFSNPQPNNQIPR